MELSKYDILAAASLRFSADFHTDKKKTGMADKFEIDGDGLKKTVKTDFMPYTAAKIKLAEICSELKKHGKSEWDDVLKIGIKFPESVCDIYRINAMKLVLSFDDTSVTNVFPDRKNRIGSRSVTELIKPGVTPDSLRSPLCSGIYGINLSETADNIISFRYIGGTDWQDKYREISALADKWILDIYAVVTNPEYTGDEISKLSSLSKADKSFDDIFVSYAGFTERYKNVHMMVDLYDMDGRENIFWPSISERMKNIFRAFKDNPEINVTVNYDTDAGRLQLKDAKLYGVSGLRDTDIVDCAVSGDMSNCSLYFSHVTNTNAEFCEFFNGCDVMKSELSGCYIAEGVTLTGTYIYGDSTVSGNCRNCELAAGVKYTKDADIKDSENNATKI